MPDGRRGLAHRGTETVTVWRRDKTVFLDQPGKPEVPLGQGKDVALTLTQIGPYVIWTASSGIEISKPGQENPALLSAGGAFPTLVSLSDENVLAAWEQDGTIETQRLE